jgi:asparagine synthetase B (glutamine-hydrolysing)
MCGISAIFRFEGDAGADLADLDLMHRAQRHRGPDGEGALVINQHLQGRRYERLPVPNAEKPEQLRLVAAVRRLRISDLRALADQPLVSRDWRHWVMLNGAIYNFRELAAELSAAGHRFHTGSDAEVVLQAYRQWGTSCFARFNGMWAILIVDLDRKVLVASRDRIGIKPFYFALDRTRLLFASEPWAIAKVLAGGPAIGTTRFFEFLSGYPPQSAALSSFRGVNPVPAGTWFETDLRDARVAEPRFRAYWDLADYRCDGAPPMSFADAAERFRELLLGLQIVDLARQLRGIARNYQRSYRDVALSYLVGPLRRHLRKGRVLPSYSWLERRAWDAAKTECSSGRNADRGRDRSLLNRMLYRETRHTNVPAVLMYSDRNAMAHSVEARFPYLDHRIVELCFSLAASYKVGFGRRKLLLLETAKHYLPARVVASKEKRRFVLMSNWMPLRDKHAAALRDASRNTAWTKLAYVDAAKLRMFVDGYLADRHQDGYAVWRIYTASRWLELFGL